MNIHMVRSRRGSQTSHRPARRRSRRRPRHLGRSSRYQSKRAVEAGGAHDSRCRPDRNPGRAAPAGLPPCTRLVDVPRWLRVRRSRARATASSAQGAMKRGDLHWATLPPPAAGRRPVLVITRTSALQGRSRLTVAPVTTVIRGTPTELSVGRNNGLPTRSVASCDNLMTIEKSDIDPQRVGRLTIEQFVSLDQALKFALGIVY